MPEKEAALDGSDGDKAPSKDGDGCVRAASRGRFHPLYLSRAQHSFVSLLRDFSLQIVSSGEKTSLQSSRC